MPSGEVEPVGGAPQVADLETRRQLKPRPQLPGRREVAADYQDARHGTAPRPGPRPCGRATRRNRRRGSRRAWLRRFVPAVQGGAQVASLPSALGKLVVRQQAADGGGHLAPGARGRTAAPHRRRPPAGPSVPSRQREPARHRLEHRQPEALDQRRQHERVRQPVERVELVVGEPVRETARAPRRRAARRARAARVSCAVGAPGQDEHDVVESSAGQRVERACARFLYGRFCATHSNTRSSASSSCARSSARRPGSVPAGRFDAERRDATAARRPRRASADVRRRRQGVGEHAVGVAHAVPHGDAHLEVRPAAGLPFVRAVQPDQVVQRDRRWRARALSPDRCWRGCGARPGGAPGRSVGAPGTVRERAAAGRSCEPAACPADGRAQSARSNSAGASRDMNRCISIAGSASSRPAGQPARVTTDAPGALAQEQQVEPHAQRARGRVVGAGHRRMRLEDGALSTRGCSMSEAHARRRSVGAASSSSSAGIARRARITSPYAAKASSARGNEGMRAEQRAARPREPPRARPSGAPRASVAARAVPHEGRQQTDGERSSHRTARHRRSAALRSSSPATPSAEQLT